MPKDYAEWLDWLLDREEITRAQYEEAMRLVGKKVKLPTRLFKRIRLPDIPVPPRYLVQRRGFTYEVERSRSGRFVKWVRRV